MILACFVILILCALTVLFCRKRKNDIQISLCALAISTTFTIGVLVVSYIVCASCLDGGPKNNDFNTYFPLTIATSTSVFTISLTYISAWFSGKDKTEQKAQHEAVMQQLKEIKESLKKLDDIQTKLETLENNLPTKQDTPTSKDSLLCRLLRCLCGE